MAVSKSAAQKKKSGDAKEKKEKPKYQVSVFADWCKACGICIAFCPKGVFRADKTGLPRVIDSDRCVGCRFCEIHCPDMAVTVQEEKPRRRRNDV